MKNLIISGLVVLIILGLISPSLSQEKKEILLNFQNASIDQVLDFYSKLTGLTVVRDDQVKGLVTIINTSKLTKEEAIKVIEEAIGIKDFSIVRLDGIVRVSSKPEDNYEIRVFGLQNAKATKVAEILNSLSGTMPDQARKGPARVIEGPGYLEGKMKVVADERTNSLIITTLPSNFPSISELISQLDVRSAQVLIEVLIAEVTLDDTTRFGLDLKWIGAVDEATGEARMDWGGLKADSSKPIPDEKHQGLAYWLLKGDLKVETLLHMLATKTNLNILSTPHILTSDNQEAKIMIGEEVPFLKETRHETGGEEIKTYEYKDVGIELTVTPSISENRDVALDIHQKINKVGTYVEDLGAYKFAKREAKTSVVVKDKETVIIGGLIKDDKITVIQKVPLLGDIPYLGFLFSKRETIVEKTELLVFITPHVIFSPEEAKELTKDQEEKASQIRKQLKSKEETDNGRH